MKRFKTVFLSTADHGGTYSLRLAWKPDGAISYQVASGGDDWSEKMTVQQPGFTVTHVSVHASGMKGIARCSLDQ